MGAWYALTRTLHLSPWGIRRWPQGAELCLVLDGHRRARADCSRQPAQARPRSGPPTRLRRPRLQARRPRGEAVGGRGRRGIPHPPPSPPRGAAGGRAGRWRQVGGRRAGEVGADAGQAAAPPRSLLARLRRRHCPSWAGGGEDGGGRGGGGGGGGGIWSFPPQRRRRRRQRPLGSRRGRRPRLRWRAAAAAVVLPAGPAFGNFPAATRGAGAGSRAERR